MKIILPSLGHYGLKWVDMRQPNVNDVRSMQSMNQENEDLMRIQIVQSLVTDLDLTKITYYDLEYLYTVAAFAILMNTVSYKVKCDRCKKVHNYTYQFGSQEVTTLEKIDQVLKRTVLGQEYEFRVLSAQDYLDSVMEASTADNYDTALEDNITAKILGKSLEETIHLDLAIYVAANMFHNLTFHGIKLQAVEQCECGRVHDTVIRIRPGILARSLSSIVAQYSQVSDMITFDAFINMTIPEYRAFLESLSKK